MPACPPMKQPNHYAEYGLERIAERRGDDAWLAGQYGSADAAAVALWRSRAFVAGEDEPQAVRFRPAELEPVLDRPGRAAFLGRLGGAPHFAVDVSHLEAPEALAPFAGRGSFVDLRSVGALLPRGDGGVLAYAKGLLHWHRGHRFCGSCGAPTAWREAGHLLVCGGAECGAQHFPRTDPAVIMLVGDGDRVVLGRKAEWPDGMYSALAGFVEPGESLEEAVAREVREEVGIAVANVRYHSSQPWPFPASLMLGFYADAETRAIAVNPDELEDARWFTRAELAGGGAGIARRPRSDSIARRLIEDWVRGRPPGVQAVSSGLPVQRKGSAG